MNWFVLGGIMMWPLLLISILGTALIIERLFFYQSLRFPPKHLEKLLTQSLQSGNLSEVLRYMRSPIFNDFSACLTQADLKNREAALRLSGGAVLTKADSGLALLGMIGRIAPLIGLLGTVLGMIQTFSRIASTHGAVDMPLLAGGIWQALITTAAGLIIAVPVVFARHFFLRRKIKIAVALENIGNTALALEPSPHASENARVGFKAAQGAPE